MKFLIVGGGSIGKRHLKNLKELGYDDLFCLKREKDELFSENFKCQVITSFDELKHNLPDMIICCNPTSLHIVVVKLAQQNNIPLFMEKPLTHKISDLNTIKKIWPKNLNFFIGFMLRFHPAIVKLKNLLKSKECGNIFYARFEFGSFLPNWHPNENYTESYAAKKELGGGVVNTISHELDLMLYFFGEPLSVFTKNSKSNIIDIETEDISNSIFEYDFGIVNIHLDFLQKRYSRKIEFICENGKINWEWTSNVINIIKNDNTTNIKIENFSLNQMYIDELVYFINKVKLNQNQHKLDFDTAIINTEWMLGMHESNLKNQKWKK